MPAHADSGLFEQHPGSGQNPLVQGGNTVTEEFADMFTYWVYGGFDGSLAGQVRQQLMDEWLLGGLIYGDLIRTNATATDVSNVVYHMTSNGSETQIASGLDIASLITLNVDRNPDDNPFNFAINAEDSIRSGHIVLYTNAIENAFGITIQQGTGSDAEDINEHSSLNYQILHNYDLGAEALANLYEDVMMAYELDFDRYELFQETMGDILIIRTGDRSTVSGDSQDAYGFNAEHIIYDIFDDETGTQRTSIMSPLNFTHELLHSFHKFSAFGGEGNSAINALSAQDTDAMNTVDDTLLGNSNVSVQTVENNTGLQIRGDYSNNNPTFRQNFTSLYDEELVDAMTYAAYGLYDHISPDFRDELHQLMATGIRQSVLYHTSGEQISPFQNLVGVSVPMSEGSNPVGIRFELGPDGNFTNAQLGAIPKSPNVANNELSTVSVYGQTQLEGGETWVFVGYEVNVGNPPQTITRYGWIDANFLLENVEFETNPVSVEEIHPNRTFTVDDPLNPVFFQENGG